VKPKKNKNNILLIGCGEMGTSLLKGFLSSSCLPKNIQVVEKHIAQAKKIKKHFRVKVINSIQSIENNFVPEIVIFSIKPQIMDRVLPNYKNYLEKWKRSNPLVISLAAGYRLNNLRKIFGTNYNFIRIMPNLPVEYQQGIIGAFAKKKLSHRHRSFCEILFASLGYFVWVQNERTLDSLTAFSGSGPAYVFYFCECLEKAALELGFNSKMAFYMSRFLILGSSSILEKSDQSSEYLRKRVTSPRGTTEAAIKVLLKGKRFEKIIRKAIFAARSRAKKLSK
tara:strand:- start:2313 stop:3155 length:843 start_codon:yes stop_codon:yes gene_type:complete